MVGNIKRATVRKVAYVRDDQKMPLRTGGALENRDVITEQAHGRLFRGIQVFSPMPGERE